ncbi:hypothetical protein [Vibrio cholerae]|uniref:hypothetical protein n=1 Tax=Vibrio cholerae TaxID=666 RepID=UPI0012AECE52|nr:hypothetical protein [Vibrio cholerae]
MPDFIAKIRIYPSFHSSNCETDLLCSVMLKRHTNRQKFDDRKPSEQLLKKLIQSVEEEGVFLEVISKDDMRMMIAKLVAKGDRIQAANKDFRRELSSWIRPNKSKLSDGLPGYAFGVGDLASRIGAFVLRTFDWGTAQANRDQRLVVASPLLLVLCTRTDTKISWLNA